ncbi:MULTISPECIES: hypothetical protein [Stenotrophomonas]|uniref:hypothetical protein n=1 Tax=Stenotrophomonas TaxID=40323 RepID=UPI0012E3B2F8|nr:MULTISPECIES: hypothetical protein [Stenotrophomonas]
MKLLTRMSVVLSILLMLVACSSAPARGPSEAEDAAIKENCALARERQNEIAIAHWCDKSAVR